MSMRKAMKGTASGFLFILFSAVFLQADQRGVLSSLAADLEQKASGLAQSSFDYFKGWNGTISDQEQAVLFKSEAFAASCRLFLKLAEERSDFFQTNQLRTNLYSAFTYLFSSFQELDQEMQKTGVRPYELRDCRQVLRRMEQAFADWPSPDNLAYLDQRYVKDRRAAVYLIVKKSTAVFIKYPFKNLESLYRYNYNQNRGKNPWDYLVEVKTETLNKMEQGDLIDLNFEGRLVIEQSNKPNRPVYLIEGGKRRGLTSPSVLARYGGWSKVFEVPDEVINSYPEGDPID
jgi:hypothetical protein